MKHTSLNLLCLLAAKLLFFLLLYFDTGMNNLNCKDVHEFWYQTDFSVISETAVFRTVADCLGAPFLVYLLHRAIQAKREMHGTNFCAVPGGQYKFRAFQLGGLRIVESHLR